MALHGNNFTDYDVRYFFSKFRPGLDFRAGERHRVTELLVGKVARVDEFIEPFA
ncbi:hypothetical protein SDC9_169878 [bioreactor metagenome]|uniref:Uncharacterized protein n=1 Tax=bioreactor metagenome TaxID=1076179 RepID=A0A645G773_9ZZZZ